jgi:hypothetical protein
MDSWGAPNEDKGASGYRNLQEAAAIAALFELALGGGAALPAEFREFLRFRAGTDF